MNKTDEIKSQSYDEFSQQIAHPLHYFSDEEEPETSFSTQVNKFYKTIVWKKPPAPLLTLVNLTNDSFIIAEKYHTSIASKKFLIDNMQALKADGYIILFMEHLYYDVDQKDLNFFHDTGKMSASLKKRLRTLDDGWGSIIKNPVLKDQWKIYNFTAVVEAAQAAGIRIAAIDLKEIYEAQYHPKFCGTNQRIGFMNYTAYHIMNREISQIKPSDKWIALMGCMHVKSCCEYPGVSDLVGARSLLMADKIMYEDKPLTEYTLNPEQLQQLCEFKTNTIFKEISTKMGEESKIISFTTEVLIDIHPGVTLSFSAWKKNKVSIVHDQDTIDINILFNLAGLEVTYAKMAATLKAAIIAHRVDLIDSLLSTMEAQTELFSADLFTVILSMLIKNCNKYSFAEFQGLVEKLFKLGANFNKMQLEAKDLGQYWKYLFSFHLLYVLKYLKLLSAHGANFFLSSDSNSVSCYSLNITNWLISAFAPVDKEQCLQVLIDTLAYLINHETEENTAIKAYAITQKLINLETPFIAILHKKIGDKGMSRWESLLTTAIKTNLSLESLPIQFMSEEKISAPKKLETDKPCATELFTCLTGLR